MTCLIDHDICNGLNTVIKCCHGLSAGKLFVASCRRELQTKP